MEVISVIPRRLDVINKYKEQGGYVAAVLPIHYPRALLRAFNVLPVEVWGPPRVDTSHGATHLQPYICSIVHNTLSFLQMGGLDITDVIIIPHACDSLQGLGSVLLDFVPPDKPIVPIYLPRGRRESDIVFLTREFYDVYQRLEAITGRAPSDADLMKCIRREEGADEVLIKLHQSHSCLPLTDIAFYRLIRSREYLPAETFIELAQAVLAKDIKKPRDGIPILLSGIVPEPMNFLEAISEMGAMIVADDLACCGRRLYLPGRSGDPLRRMAERIIYAPPDPTRGNPIRERREHLLRLIENSGAKGFVFYDVKFCEPELFDLPTLRCELQKAKVPSVTVEVDINDPLSHQTLTRIEAFLEMIK